MKEKNKKILLRCLSVLFIGFLVWSIFRQNYQEVLELILQVPFKLVAFLLALGMLYQCMEAGICYVLVRRYLKDFSYFSSLQLVFLGFFTNIVSMGTGVIPAKSYYLYKKGMPVGRGVSVMTYEYIFHKTAVLLWAIFLLPLISGILQEDRIGMRWWMIIGIVITAGVNLLLVLLCTWEKFRSFSFYILEKISFKGEWKQKKETWKEQIDGLFRESKFIIKDKKLIVRMLILNITKVAVLYSIPWLSLMAVGEEGVCGPGKSFVLASLMVLMTSAIPHIAGMGPAEFMFLFLYGFYASEAGTASAMLLYRAATYFLPFAISMIVVFCGKRAEKAEKNKRKKEEKTAEEKIKKEIHRLTPDYRYGLTEQQVTERKEGGWSNIEVDASSMTVRKIVRKNVLTYFNLIFAALAVLLCMVGSIRNLSFLPIVIINTVVGIVQEIKAKNVLEKMSILNAPRTNVVREGRIQSVASEELVADDIVIFKNGSQICADAVVCSGEVRVNESLLTGESEEILKKKGDFLLSGSFVAAGKCHARLEKVGDESYISKLTLKAKTMREGEQSEMIRSLDRLVRTAGIAIIPIGIALFVQSYFWNQISFRDSVTAMVAAVIGMIPEGLYLLATMALTVSSIRLASKKVLLHDMKSIEALARVDVLCVDKTGTITENRMEVKDFILLDNTAQADTIRGILSDFVSAMEAENTTMKALKAYFTEVMGQKPLKLVPFTSVNKYSGVMFQSGSYVLGAPEVVLGEKYADYDRFLKQYAQMGYRLLIFGKYHGEMNGNSLTEEITPLALLVLMNPIRREAPATFAYFAEQGVEVKVISGDNPLTAAETARQAGIPNAERYIDAGTLQKEEDIAYAVQNYTVFGRVLPEQKRLFVQALKKQGRTVAMTGDGVNDVLALKDADCSVALASGSEAAMQVSQVVLLESDFSRMPEVVAEGRRVVNNIQQSASLFLVKNIFSFLLALISIGFVFKYPLEPSQISLVAMFTIGIPGFFLSLQPNEKRITGNFLANVLLKALPAGITDALLVAFLSYFGIVFQVGEADISTAATMLLAIVGFMILYRICQPMNLIRGSICIGCIAGIIGASLLFPRLFGINAMSQKCMLLLILFSVATEPVLRYLTRLNEGIQRTYKNCSETMENSAGD